MIKFIYVILMNLFRAPYMIPKMRREADHPEKYSVEERYALARHVIRLMKVTGGIHTKSYGTELLPTEGGYMMYPNHQGKYDALGIIYTHREPCSLVMDKAKSNTILVREFVDLLQGKRLDKKDVRQALTIINEVSEEVKQGKRYILFPEGGYEDINDQFMLGEDILVAPICEKGRTSRNVAVPKGKWRFLGTVIESEGAAMELTPEDGEPIVLEKCD